MSPIVKKYRKQKSGHEKKVLRKEQPMNVKLNKDSKLKHMYKILGLTNSYSNMN